MTYNVIQVGTGAMGSAWCAHILPKAIDDGLVEVVAAADIDPDALQVARDELGLTAEQCYTDTERAFEENADADFCTVVVPPSVHEEIVDLALAHDMHVLSEKPIADTLEASVRIAKKVEAAEKKMGVTMSHRFDQDKTTLRRELRSGDHGPLDYLVGRFTCEARTYGAWGEFRHEIEDALLVEGGVHQLDFIADMMDANCDTLFAQTWTPPWGEYAGDAQALVQMHFENGTRAFWEGAKCNATTLNCWGHDYIRAECRDATLVLDDRSITCHPYDPARRSMGDAEDPAEAVPLAERETWTNVWLVEQFVDWLDGGPEMPTNVWDNLQSMALISSAIESSRTGQPVAVQEKLEAAIDDVTIA